MEQSYELFSLNSLSNEQYHNDISILRKYLVFFDEYHMSQDHTMVPRLMKDFEECKKKIEQTQKDITNRIEELRKNNGEKFNKFLKSVPDKTEANRDIHMLFRFLIKKLEKIYNKDVDRRIGMLEDQMLLLDDLNTICDNLLQNPIPVMIKITRSITSIDQTTSSKMHPLGLKMTMIRSLAHSQQVRLQLIPIPFDSEKENKTYLMDIIENGVLAKKKGTIYFNELQAEETLHVFFRSKSSPLVDPSKILKEQKPLYPYDGGYNPEAVDKWIKEAVSIFIKWLHPKKELNEDEIGSLSILLVRFIFADTYPLLYPSDSYDPVFVQKMENFAAKTPEEVGILPKYIPEQCKNQPVTKLFEIDSVSRAPVEWFRSAMNQFSPIDAAFCIVKVHESLSVMAVLRATSKKENSGIEDFCEKMPGFDDIFEIWLSLVCSSGNPNPHRLMKFISDFSFLPGFTSLVNLSVAYLEASLSQLGCNEE